MSYFNGFRAHKLLLALLVVNTLSHAGTDVGAVKSAWDSGDFDQVHILASQQFASNPHDEVGKLLVKTSVLKGQDEQALALFEKLDEETRSSNEIFPFILHAYTNLGRFQQAAKLAEASNQPENIQAWWRLRAERPLSVELNQLSTIPFSQQNPLAALMPAVDIVLNGKPMLAHLDTGGAYLAMAPRLAESLGIQTIELGRGYANDQETTVHSGLVERLELGDAVLNNVPAVVLPALTGVLKGQDIEDMIILGTNVLQHFLTTWDNEKGRLILSPRNNKSARSKHLSILPDDQQRLSFFYYPDHLLLASGAIGDQPALFFVDTGLVTIDGRGNQPGAGMDHKTLAEFGFGDSLEEGSFVYPDQSIKLGPISEEGLSIRIFGERFAGALKGVKVDGLIGHGFLKHYTWTLDFDNQELLFSKISRSAEPQTIALDLTDENASEYVGDYEVVPGVNLVISYSGGKLFLQAPGQQPVPMTQADTDRFEIAAASAVITFERNDSDEVIALKLRQGANITSANRRVRSPE